jgi:hypothetical protein
MKNTMYAKMPNLNYKKLQKKAQSDTDVIMAEYWKAKAYGLSDKEAINKAIEIMLPIGFDKIYWQEKVEEIVKRNIKEAKLQKKSDLNKESYGGTAPNFDVINAFLNRQGTTGGSYKEGKRQWSTNGEALFYWDSEIAKWEGEQVVISDAGWHTLTTRDILDGILESMGYSFKIYVERGMWYFNVGDKAYKWIGSLKLNPDGSTREFVDVNNNPIPEINIRDIQREKREILKNIRNDAQKIEDIFLQKADPIIQLNEIVENPEMYGDYIENSLIGFLFEYLQTKGYSEYYQRGLYDLIEEAIIVTAINNIEKIDENKILVTFRYQDQYERENEKSQELDIEPNATIENITDILNVTPQVKKDRWSPYKEYLLKALRYYADKKQTEELAGREYEAFR